MKLIDDRAFSAMSSIDKSKFLIRFLYGLTLAFRDLQTSEGNDVKKDFVGLNQVSHYVLSYIDENLNGRIERFPADELIGYISNIGDGYGLEHQISIAWTQAQNAEL